MIGLNKRNGGVRFNQAISADQQFNIKRPAFLAGTTDNSYSNPQLPKNERNGLGNRTIIRNNFLAPKIKNRFLNDLPLTYSANH